MIAITSKLPWWVAVVLAIAVYVGLHSVATSKVMAVVQPGKMGEFVGQTLFKTLASVGQYLLPFVFLIGAAMSAYGRAKRQALHAQVASSHDRGAPSALFLATFSSFSRRICYALRRYPVRESRTDRIGATQNKVELIRQSGL